MTESKRRIFTGSQKANVAVVAVKGTRTVNPIDQEYEAHPTFLTVSVGPNQSALRLTLTGSTPRSGSSTWN